MKRRNVIAAVGSLLGAAGLAGGSGAFSFLRAERDLDVVVTHDNDAYLGLRQLGGGGRSFEDGTPEQVRLSFPGVSESWHNPSDPAGLGTDSVYEFVRDADGSTDGLLEITNRGTRDVEFEADWENGGGPEVELFDVTDPNRTALRDQTPYPLDVGESLRVGVRIDTHGVDIGGGNGPGGAYLVTLVLRAEIP